MSKQKQAINPDSRKKLKQICEELHITQKQLSDASFVSENTLSKIATGKGPLTRPVAEAIIKACPSFRIEWLLGLDDEPHDVHELYIQGLREAQECLYAIDLLDNFGIEIGQVSDKGIFLPASQMRGFIYSNKNVEIRRGGKTTWEGRLQTIEHALLDICEFSLFKIEQLQKKKEV